MLADASITSQELERICLANASIFMNGCIDRRMAGIEPNMYQETPVVQVPIATPSGTSSSQSGQPPLALDIVQHLQALEISINSKFSELQDLLQQHDRSMKMMLKSHQNSMKQSVKAQLEKSQIDQRRYIDAALQRNGGTVQALADPPLSLLNSNTREPWYGC